MRRFSKRRARKTSPIIVGLTGSIAMGKSTAAKMLKDLGIPVFDSDAASRASTAPGGAATAALKQRFPDAFVNGALDRQALAKKVFSSAHDLKALEAIVHPIVRANRRHFMRRAAHQRRQLVVFDIPLLFETNSEHECDVVLVVSAPAFLQRQRALARPGMDDARLKGVLAKQMPDHQKRARADVVVPTGLGKAHTLRVLKKALMFI